MAQARLLHIGAYPPPPSLAVPVPEKAQGLGRSSSREAPRAGQEETPLPWGTSPCCTWTAFRGLLRRTEPGMRRERVSPARKAQPHRRPARIRKSLADAGLGGGAGATRAKLSSPGSSASLVQRRLDAFLRCSAAVGMLLSGEPEERAPPDFPDLRPARALRGQHPGWPAAGCSAPSAGRGRTSGVS